jgi:hypothetical protein
MSSYDGLQVVQDDGFQRQYYEAPIPVGQHPHEAPIPVLPNSYEKGPQIGVESGYGTPSGQKILGMRKKAFWLVLAITFVVIVAAIGGGVWASLAIKKTTSSGQPVTQRLVHYSLFNLFMLLLHLAYRNLVLALPHHQLPPEHQQRAPPRHPQPPPPPQLRVVIPAAPTLMVPSSLLIPGPSSCSTAPMTSRAPQISISMTKRPRLSMSALTYVMQRMREIIILGVKR